MAAKIAELIAQVRFRHLKMILELARTGSLRAASDNLHLSQPAISKTLAQLEDVFGFALFERSAHGLTSTAQGKVALRWASVLVAELEHFLEEAQAQAAENTPTVILRLGAPPVVALSSIPSVLGILLAETPNMTVQLFEDSTTKLLKSLVAGDLDLLLTTYGGAAMAAHSHDQLRYEKFKEEEFVVIAPPANPLTRARRVEWNQLATERWILPGTSSFTRQSIEASFIRAGIHPPKPHIESSSPTTSVRLVANGLGISAVPAAISDDAERINKVKRIDIASTSPFAPVALVYRTSMVDDPVVNAVRAAILTLK